MDNGIPLFGAINLGFAAKSLDRFDRQLDAFSDVFEVIRIDGDRRNFDKTTEQ
jgi:hypothetical protein